MSFGLDDEADQVGAGAAAGAQPKLRGAGMGLTLEHGIDDRNNSSNYEYVGQVSETVPSHVN